MAGEMSSVPVVDIGNIGLCVEEDELREEDVRRTASQLMDAFTTMGFVYITHHGIQQQQIEQVHATGREFFALSTTTKDRYHLQDKGKEHGYVRLEEEGVIPGNPGDLKECFNMQMNDTEKWPTEVPKFKDVSCEFFRTCQNLSMRLMKTIAAGLNLEDLDFFSKCHNPDKCPNGTTLRLLHYPPIPTEVKAGQTRLGKHTDYGTITLLFQGPMGGLQVLSQSGEWLEAPPMPGAILVNIADLLQHWSGNILRSTPHQVTIPEEEAKQQKARYSVVFFVHPDSDYVITPLDGSDSFAPVTAGQYLADKLNATYY